MIEVIACLTVVLLIAVLMLLIDDLAAGDNSQISEWSYDFRSWRQGVRERRAWKKRMDANLRRSKRINPELWEWKEEQRNAVEQQSQVIRERGKSED